MVLNNNDVIISIASRGKFLVQKTDSRETLHFFQAWLKPVPRISFVTWSATVVFLLTVYSTQFNFLVFFIWCVATVVNVKEIKHDFIYGKMGEATMKKVENHFCKGGIHSIRFCAVLIRFLFGWYFLSLKLFC